MLNETMTGHLFEPMAAQAGAPVKGGAKVVQPMSAAAPNHPGGRRHRRRPLAADRAPPRSGPEIACWQTTPREAPPVAADAAGPSNSRNRGPQDVNAC